MSKKKKMIKDKPLTLGDKWGIQNKFIIIKKKKKESK